MNKGSPATKPVLWIEVCRWSRLVPLWLILSGVFGSGWVEIRLYGQLDESWAISLGGQTLQVQPNGSFRFDGVSVVDSFGEGGAGTPSDGVGDNFLRIVGVRTHGGRTVYCYSQPFQIRNLQTVFVQDLTFTERPPPQPDALQIVAARNTLPGVGATLPLTVNARMVDGTVLDVSLRTEWTTYRSSNPQVATVSKDGVVTAVGDGPVFVTAQNEGVASVLRLRVLESGPKAGVAGSISQSFSNLLVHVSTSLSSSWVEPDGQGGFLARELPLADGSVHVLTLGRSGGSLYLGSVTSSFGLPNQVVDLGEVPMHLIVGTNDLLKLRPFAFDSNGDGIPDGLEDFDRDGLVAAAELLLGTDPAKGDSDANGVPDPEEDFDGDSSSNLQEIQLGTNPFDPDSDGDRWNDGLEVAEGTDGTSPESTPNLLTTTFRGVNASILTPSLSSLSTESIIVSSPTVLVSHLSEDITIATPTVLVYAAGQGYPGFDANPVIVAQPVVRVLSSASPSP